MNVMALRRQYEKLVALVDQAEYSKFSCYRDDEGNLHLIFADGKKFRLPVLKFRPYQVKVQTKRALEGCKRFFLVWPRRAGKEVVSWNLLLQAAFEQPGLYLMIYPSNVRAKAVWWDGAITMPDGSSLKFLDMIPKQFIKSINKQEMSITLTNEAILRGIGSDVDPDKMRGMNPRAVAICEFAFCDPRVLDILRPIFTQNGGWYILQTTFDGMNHAYDLMQTVANDPDWYCQIEDAESLVDEEGRRYITDEMIDAERRSGMPEWMIQQEYYCRVATNQETIYFAQEISDLQESNRVVPKLILPGRPVYTASDLGMRDANCVLMFQLDEFGKPVIVNFFESNNKKLEYYIETAWRFCRQHNLILKTHFLPHDGNNNYNRQTGITDREHFLSLGEDAQVTARPAKKEHAIQAMRRMLYQCRFNQEKTTRLLKGLSNYSKEFDAKHKIYKDHPRHDWASHIVDSFQTMTLALEAKLAGETLNIVRYYT